MRLAAGRWAAREMLDARGERHVARSVCKVPGSLPVSDVEGGCVPVSARRTVSAAARATGLEPLGQTLLVVARCQAILCPFLGPEMRVDGVWTGLYDCDWLKERNFRRARLDLALRLADLARHEGDAKRSPAGRPPGTPTFQRSTCVSCTSTNTKGGGARRFPTEQKHGTVPRPRAGQSVSGERAYIVGKHMRAASYTTLNSAEAGRWHRGRGGGTVTLRRPSDSLQGAAPLRPARAFGP
jgi:hypothetical protein